MLTAHALEQQQTQFAADLQVPSMDEDHVLDGIGFDDDIPDFLDELDRLRVEVPEPGEFEATDACFLHADGCDDNQHSSRYDQAGPACTQDLLEQRMERTRARNRAAQARYRNKLKA